MIKIKFLKDYHGFKEGQEFEFKTDKSIVFVGDNGTGKSTLLRLIYAKALFDEGMRNEDIRNKFNDNSKSELIRSLSKSHALQDIASIGGIPQFKDKFLEDYVNKCVADVTITNIKNFTARMYDMNMANLANTEDADNLANNRKTSSKDYATILATHLGLTNMSKGESTLNQMFDFIKNNMDPEREGKLKRWLILDEVDSGVSVKHAEVLTKYLNPEYSGKIMSFHNPILIQNCKRVYWINKDIDNHITIKECSGQEYLDAMKKEAQEIIDQMIQK